MSEQNEASKKALLEWALYYARNGWRVFPCKPGEKTPATKNGFKDATTEQQQIQEWWSVAPYNIGLATGGGLAVLDVDINHGAGKFGDETLNDLERRYGALPNTLTVLTGSGGAHYYFASNDPALTVGVNIAPGLDYRAGGGYVIAPPSIHPNGNMYEWEVTHRPGETPLADMPEWLHKLLLSSKKQTAAAGAKNDNGGVWREGERNQKLFELACSLRAKGLNTQAIEAALQVENVARCQPPVTAAEVRQIAGSAAKYQQGEVKASRQQKPPAAAPIITAAGAITYAPPAWVIKPYFQLGKGTLIQGDNGSGKTAFMCAIAAHISSGRPILNTPINQPGAVLILSVEDDLPILRGRLEACGADLGKCYFVTNAASAELTLNDPRLEELIQQVQAKLIILDPFQAFLGKDIDMFRANETRPVLARLFEMCEKNGCACAIVAHTGKKSATAAAVNQSLGSVDIPAAMRSIVHIAKDRQQQSPNHYAVQVKSSNAEKGQALKFKIGERGGVIWQEYSSMTIEDINRLADTIAKPHIPYEHEPLVQVFNQLIADKPKGGFWSYAELSKRGAEILGYPPFEDKHELRKKLDSGLAKELQQNDGLIVVHSEKGRANQRGVSITPYTAPESYQGSLSLDEDNQD